VGFRAVAAVGAVGCAAAVGISGELSAGALVAVLAAGAVVVVLGLARRSGAAAPRVGRRGLPWLGWLVVAATWELGTLVADGLPTVSDLADPLLAHPLPRAGATLVWLAAGAWLLARPRRPEAP
jgi:hypothetical protein